MNTAANWATILGGVAVVLGIFRYVGKWIGRVLSELVSQTSAFRTLETQIRHTNSKLDTQTALLLRILKAGVVIHAPDDTRKAK